MLNISKNPRQGRTGAAVLVIGVILALLATSAYGEKKKKGAASATPPPSVMNQLDISKIVWPNPPAITRLRYLDFFAAEKVPLQGSEKKNKKAWMDRLAGVATGETKGDKPLFQLAQPYGLAIDSKNRLYVADSKVRAIFIFNTETKDVEFIKNGVHARFALITGLAIDDSDRLFVSDSVLRHVVVFDRTLRAEATIAEGMASPAGLAIDNENRFLYVADTDLDQVLVYDADNFKLLRKIGTAGQAHRLTEAGQFSRPTNVAVDAEGNLYVSDTFNNRVEIFDADGNFISTFGNAADRPGYFARPKGIAIDKDGHVWVADTVQDRVQVFTREGRLLLWLGGHGILPGQFSAVQGLAIDKNSRVFTSEQYPGRVQMFRYVTNDEALQEKARRDAGKAAGEKTGEQPPVNKNVAAEKPQSFAVH
ncbi:MAG TPA: SMP-30/gluconolactonase/LRE family protein [Terriglobales bacterium]|nr:SMP-30/gluconolactonase/LRE family protein [Terriglobales bacterium]